MVGLNAKAIKRTRCRTVFLLSYWAFCSHPVVKRGLVSVCDNWFTGAQCHPLLLKKGCRVAPGGVVLGEADWLPLPHPSVLFYHYPTASRGPPLRQETTQKMQCIFRDPVRRGLGGNPGRNSIPKTNVFGIVVKRRNWKDTNITNPVQIWEKLKTKKCEKNQKKD